MWCGVMWCGVVWCGVVWCGVVWCGMVWCGVVWCGVVWCSAVWCGVVWCGVVSMGRGEVWCGVVWCGVVWCGVVWCGVVWCGVVWCGVVWCGVVWCGVVWCGVPKALLPEGNGQDVYPRVHVNGRGCVCCVRAVCKCVDPGGERGGREDLVVTSLATVLTPGAPSVPLLAPLAGAGVAPAMPTPSCCLGPGGPSATWHMPWRERTRPVWTPR